MAVVNRKEEVTKFADKDARGIEIGPWFSPLTSKRDGYNCLVLDVFDAPQLRLRAKEDPAISKDRIANIEEVDLLGSSTQIEDLVAGRRELESFDYIISSHNFEHLPNPIKFLQGSGRVLKPGAMLSMAIPDKRFCFDHFRPHSTTSQLIAAYFEDRARPTLAQVFEMNSLHCRYRRGDEMQMTFTIADRLSDIVPLQTVREAFDFWLSAERTRDLSYNDAHCWTFTPRSFELIMLDLIFLGLSPLAVREISPPNGGEFYVHLQNVVGKESIDPSIYYARRAELLVHIREELSWGRDGVEPAAPDGADAEINLLRAEIAALRGSRSWRITAPLRALSGRLLKAR